MYLKNSQVAAIAGALLDAYSRSSLSIMVRTRLDLDLEMVVRDGNLRQVVHDLVEWVEAEGRVQELIREAHAGNKGNAILAKLHADSQSWTFPEPSSRRYDSPMMALAPPDDFVQRPTEYNELIDYLLSDHDQPVAITATIRGAGGFGKTTLAQAICHDERIQAAFPDGILWTSVGEDKTNVLRDLDKFYKALTGKNGRFVDQHDATVQMRNVLTRLRCLIVVDDVWNEAHLRPFIEYGTQCACLVTTRVASLIPKEAKVVRLDAMQIKEATELLGAGLEHQNDSALSSLARRLGEWPLLLRLVNRRLFEDVRYYNITLVDAITAVGDELDEFGLTSFDINDPIDRNQAVAASMSVSLKHLKPDIQYGNAQVNEANCFSKLAIFPKDTLIPVATLVNLWQYDGCASARMAERLCRRLADLSLVLNFDAKVQTILVHDVFREYLIGQARPEQYQCWQEAFLNSYRNLCNGEWWLLSDDGYIYQNLLWHLREAQQLRTLEYLLLKYSWLDAKLQTTDTISLLNDFDLRRDILPHSQFSLLKHSLQMSLNVLAQDKNQLASQLYGRLVHMGNQWRPLIEEATAQSRVAWLKSQSSALMSPGGSLLYSLIGHTKGVSNLLLLFDGRLISSSGGNEASDNSIKIWDTEKGALLHSLEGHISGVSNLLLTPDNQLISSCGDKYSGDNSIKIWDTEKGALLHSLEGHIAGASNLLLTPDGQLISSCSGNKASDSSIKIWDTEKGILLHSLEGHVSGASNLLLTPDGRLISFSGGNEASDNSIKIWDTEKGILLHSLEGHISGVSNLLLTPDGRLISSCGHNELGGAVGLFDHSIKVWDIDKGVLLHLLVGHGAGVSNLLLTADGRLVSSCDKYKYHGSDYSIKVWDIDKGVLLHSLVGHGAGVSNLLLTADGQLVSSCGGIGSRDFTIKVWDIDEGIELESLHGHNAPVTNLLLTSDTRLISSCEGLLSIDNSIKIWDIEEGVELESLEGHSESPSNLLLAHNDRLISSCGWHGESDYSIKVWDIKREVGASRFKGHTNKVSNLLLLPNRLLISYCTGYSNKDYDIKVWDIKQGEALHSLRGHPSTVSSILLRFNRQLISSCDRDDLIKVWDIEEGIEFDWLEGHTDGVSNLLLTPTGRLISSCGSESDDCSIKVWDIEEGAELHSLEGHTEGVSNLLLTPTGRLISSCGSESGDCSIKVWDIEEGAELHSLEGHTEGVSNLLLTPTGRLISSCSNEDYSDDHSIKVWDIEMGILLHSFEAHTYGVSNLLLAPDNQLISSCSSYGNSDFSIKVWDINKGVLLHSLEGHKGDVNNLLLTPDGHLVSSCSCDDDFIGNSSNRPTDYSIKVWNIKQGVLLHSLEGHTAGVSNLLLTPDGQLISSSNINSSSRDHTVKVWDINSGVMLYSLDEHITPIQHMIMTKWPNYFATSGGNWLIIWNWANGKKITQFTTDGAIASCVQADDRTVVLGDGLGQVHFLKLIEP
ncbi:MAG: NB-ARC domain-containing protein [Chloroflexota bacterium]